MFLAFPCLRPQFDFIFYATLHINTVNIKQIVLYGGYRLWTEIN